MSCTNAHVQLFLLTIRTPRQLVACNFFGTSPTVLGHKLVWKLPQLCTCLLDILASSRIPLEQEFGNSNKASNICAYLFWSCLFLRFFLFSAFEERGQLLVVYIHMYMLYSHTHSIKWDSVVDCFAPWLSSASYLHQRRSYNDNNKSMLSKYVRRLNVIVCNAWMMSEHTSQAEIDFQVHYWSGSFSKMPIKRSDIVHTHYGPVHGKS